jgi:hypothetical protein
MIRKRIFLGFLKVIKKFLVVRRLICPVSDRG